MKKYTHPKKNNSLIISKNGATNIATVYSNNFFSNASFDIRNQIEILNSISEEIIQEAQISTFINEYKYTTTTMWNKLI